MAYDPGNKYYNADWAKLDAAGLAAKRNEVIQLAQAAKKSGNTADYEKWRTRLDGLDNYVSYTRNVASKTSASTTTTTTDSSVPTLNFDPNTEIGRMLASIDLSQFAPDQMDAVARVLTQMNQFGKTGEQLADEFIKKEDYANLSPETSDAVKTAMANAMELYKNSGISTDELASIQALKTAWEKAGLRSDDMQSALDRMKELSQGYNTEQNRALREEAITGMDSDYQTKLAQLKSGAANSGVRGRYLGAQMAQLNRADETARNSFNRQWLADNAQVQAQNSQAYASTLNTVLGREQSERQSASQAYNTGANTTYTNVNARQGQNLDRYSNLAAADQSRRDAVTEYNNQINQAYDSGRMTSLLGTIGTMMGSVNNEQGAKSATAFQDWLKDYYTKTLAISSKATDAYSSYLTKQVSGSK